MQGFCEVSWKQLSKSSSAATRQEGTSSNGCTEVGTRVVQHAANLKGVLLLLAAVCQNHQLSYRQRYRPAVASCRGTLSTGRCGQRYNVREQGTEASGTAGNRTQQSWITLQSWMMHQVLSGTPPFRKVTVQPERALTGTMRHTEELCVPVQS